jgi:hypothetical protein
MQMLVSSPYLISLKRGNGLLKICYLSLITELLQYVHSVSG